MSSLKETNFFTGENTWNKGIEWYRRQFHSDRQIRGESSPFYTQFPRYKGVPERIRQTVPDSKLIYILRDPIERMISQYIHLVSLGFESRPFEEAVFSEKEPNMYMITSKYFLQLDQFLSIFDESQIHLVSNEKLDYARTETLSEVFRFLDVEQFQCKEFEKKWNEAREKRTKNRIGRFLAKTPPMRALHCLPRNVRLRIERRVYHPFSRPTARPEVSKKIRERIAEHLSSDLALLRRRTGMKFDEWSL